MLRLVKPYRVLGRDLSEEGEGNDGGIDGVGGEDARDVKVVDVLGGEASPALAALAPDADVLLLVGQVDGAGGPVVRLDDARGRAVMVLGAAGGSRHLTVARDLGYLNGV